VLTSSQYVCQPQAKVSRTEAAVPRPQEQREVAGIGVEQGGRLVVGDRGATRSEPGAPSFGGASGHRSERGDVWTTPAWTSPGTFHVTCTVHPAMNLTVTVGGQ